MTDNTPTNPIEDDIHSFVTKQPQIRSLIDSIAGNSTRKKEKVINYVFLAIIISLFVVELATDVLPPFLSLEIGVLLISIKIVWMIRIQSRFQHFTFWVLNAIEQKLNMVDAHVRKSVAQQDKQQDKQQDIPKS